MYHARLETGVDRLLSQLGAGVALGKIVAFFRHGNCAALNWDDSADHPFPAVDPTGRAMHSPFRLAFQIDPG
jgi:hypothetical protein